MITTTNLTRRTALAGAAAGTLLPVAGLANSANLPINEAEPDPAATTANATDAAWAELQAADTAFTAAYEKWEAFADWITDQIGPKPVLFVDSDPREFYRQDRAWREARAQLPENPHQHPAEGEPRERLWAAREALACAPVATMTDLERKLSVAFHVDDEETEVEFARTILDGVRAMIGGAA